MPSLGSRFFTLAALQASGADEPGKRERQRRGWGGVRVPLEGGGGQGGAYMDLASCFPVYCTGSPPPKNVWSNGLPSEASKPLSLQKPAWDSQSSTTTLQCLF